MDVIKVYVFVFNEVDLELMLLSWIKDVVYVFMDFEECLIG